MKRKLIHQYEIVRKLGAGGGGIVYYAQDSKLLRPVVLKMLRKGGTPSDELRDVVLREARLASAIEHPNICSIYEAGEWEGEAFIVMQYVPGRTLTELIERGPLRLELALSIAVQITDGLAEAHRKGIVHRDLKPANIMITDGGLVKILDFGLAKRQQVEELATASTKPQPKRRSSTRAGTLAYMAPEQFVTGKTGEQSDIFAFGVTLYEMLTGQHPFLPRGGDHSHLARFIQYAEPPSLKERRPESPPELESIVAKALRKNPAERYQSVAEVRESLRTLAHTLALEPATAESQLTTTAKGEISEPERKAGIFTLLAERFLGSESEQDQRRSLAVLPFQDMDGGDTQSFYGAALADAIATRLARTPWLVVRSANPARGQQIQDPIEAGRQMRVQSVLKGSYQRTAKAFNVIWQLLDVPTHNVTTGGNLSLGNLDLVAIQNEIAEQVFASLHGSGQLAAHSEARPAAEKAGPELSEDYLQGRALITSFFNHSARREELDGAIQRFQEALKRNPKFAPAHSGLGLAHLQMVRNGLGGLTHLMAAQKCFEQALESDPNLTEALLFRVQILLSRGEKESARHGVRHLLEKEPNNSQVRLVAGFALRLDGLYPAAMEQFNQALRLNPASATLVYNHRARVYQYEGQLELAIEEVRKGLALEPRHPLLRTSQGYLRFRQGDLPHAIALLEAVLEQDPGLRMAYPTLAMCYLAAGQRERAYGLLTEATLSAAEADSEMAYRLATFFAQANDPGEALPWLRKSIYLGNENYPWLSKNPAWEKLRENEDFKTVLSNLKQSFARNKKRWRELLA